MGWTYFLFIAIPLIPTIFTAWMFHANAIYNEYNKQIDIEYSRCPTLPPASNSSLAIVIPFPERDLEAAISHIRLWNLPQFSPILGENIYKNRTDLIFYTATKSKNFDKEFEHFKLKYQNDFQSISSIFSSFQIISANLTDSRNKFQMDLFSGQVNAAGSTEMFYPLMTKALKNFSNPYSFIFYHETDTWPIRPGWLSEFQKVIFGPDSDFWFLGTQQRQRVIPGGRVHPYMNGNFVARIENECVRNLLDKIHQEYRYLPYDISFLRYLLINNNFRITQHVIPRIQYTNLIGDFGPSHVLLEKIKETFPEMFLVHAKDLKKEMLHFLE